MPPRKRPSSPSPSGSRDTAGPSQKRARASRSTNGKVDNGVADDTEEEDEDVDLDLTQHRDFNPATSDKVRSSTVTTVLEKTAE